MRIYWQYLLLALAISFLLWFMVAGQSQVETLVDVRVEFWGQPSGLVIREGMVQKISARLRGTRGTLRVLNSGDLVYPLDLSDIKEGENVVSLEPARVIGARGAQVTEISPARLTLIADTLKTKILPLHVTVEEKLPNWLTLESVSVSPSSIQVSGPATLLNSLTELDIKVHIPADPKPGGLNLNPGISLPNELTASVTRASVHLELALKTKEVTIQRELALRGPSGAPAVNATLERKEVSLRLKIPVTAQERALLALVSAFVQVPAGAPAGRVPAAVRLDLPEYVQPISVTPDTVYVIIER